MINIGLTSFHEHGQLLNKNKLSLAEYASFFPIIELNTSFYGIKTSETSQKWCEQTPDRFQFIIKAYQSMTKHSDWQDNYGSEKEMYQAFHEFIAPLKQANKLAAILCQFPGYFDCSKENVDWLRRLRQWFPNDMLAIELRHASWYSERNQSGMLEFMKSHHFSLVIVDEPQVPIRSVPFLPVVTNQKFVYFRLHGRNKGNWLDTTEDWRKKRNLYCYSETEIYQLAEQLEKLHDPQCVAVIFNNNSAGDAGPNALTLKKQLDIDYSGLNPNQLSLF